MSADIPDPSPHHTFTYDHPVTNVGGHYNNHSGIYTVPQNGIYVMSATTIIDSNGAIIIEIVKNSFPFATGLSNSFSVSNWHTGTVTGVISAEKGDIIFVRSQNNHPEFSSSGKIVSRPWAMSSFCGWQIAWIWILLQLANKYYISDTLSCSWI